MTTLPELDQERDAAIRAALVHVPFEGWTARALRHGLEDLGLAPERGPNLFPDGPIGMIVAWRELLDREMEAAMPAMPDAGMTKRVRALIAVRLELLRPHREAARRALTVLATLGAGMTASRLITQTADAIWHAAGENAADFSWYTKRATLAAVYGTTFLYWLRHADEDNEASLAFLDRRLAQVSAFGRLRRRFTRRRKKAGPEPTSP